MSYECYMNVTFRFCFRSPLKSLKLPVFKGLSTDLGSHSFLHISFYPLYMPEVNWGMPVTTLKDTYRLDPGWGMGEDFENNNLFGVAGTLWSECINTPERIYYQAYPRALALAEAGWSMQKNRSWEGFILRMKPTLEDMMRRGITFSMEF